MMLNYSYHSSIDKKSKHELRKKDEHYCAPHFSAANLGELGVTHIDQTSFF